MRLIDNLVNKNLPWYPTVWNHRYVDSVGRHEWNLVVTTGQKSSQTRHDSEETMFVVLNSRRSLSSAVQRRVLLNDFIIGRFR